MPSLENLSVNLLKLDLSNYRMVHQTSETNSINSMLSISPDRFLSLMESIIDDGYYSTENIIVLKTKMGLIVKEGNRRVAALKIIHGYVKGIELPDNIRTKITTLNDEWKKNNASIPCNVYEETESETVKRLVSLVHAKGEKAGRENWSALARARYDRDVKGEKETGLDLLEKYLINAKNLTENQQESWGGDYAITVLDELLPKLYPYLACKTADELLKQYPTKKRKIIEDILYDIGIKRLGFKEIRSKSFWGINYGLSEVKPTVQSTPENPSKGKNDNQSNVNTGSSSANPSKTKPPAPAHSLTDPKSVQKELKGFKPVGKDREKLVSLLNEIKELNIEKHPFSFCFLLRSMFEISAKVYCQEHTADGLSPRKSDGNDKELANLLREIVSSMTSGQTNKEKTRTLHGAITELAKKDGILSVTSMNQLVHNPKFSIQPSDICIVFHNIFPLLEEMNS